MKRIIVKLAPKVSCPGLIFCFLLLFFISMTADASTASQELQDAARLLRAGNLKKAEEALEKLLRSQPADPSTLNMLGVVRARQNRLEEAERLFYRSLDLNPKLYGAYINLSRKQKVLSQRKWSTETPNKYKAKRRVLRDSI